MKKFALIILLFACVAGWIGAVPPRPQQPQKFRPIDVNMDSVRKDIQNPASNYYYKRLWRKFESNDTNMSLQEYRHLYLGYVFTEDYDPYRVSEFSRKVVRLYTIKQHSPAQCDTIIEYAEKSLANYPFDLKQMEFFVYVLKEKKKFTRPAIWQFRLNNLIKAIMSTGRGTKDEPWVVTSPLHEHYIVNALGYSVKDVMEYEGDIDYVEVQNPKAGGPKGFWFDVSNILRVRSEKFGDQ